MPAYQQKAGDIAVFLETDKRNERGPDWRGRMVTPEGEVLEVALWAKGEKGTMLAGNVQTPRSRPPVTDAEIDRDYDRNAASGRIQAATDRFGSKPVDPDDAIPFATCDPWAEPMGVISKQFKR